MLLLLLLLAVTVLVVAGISSQFLALLASCGRWLSGPVRFGESRCANQRSLVPASSLVADPTGQIHHTTVPDLS